MHLLCGWVVFLLMKHLAVVRVHEKNMCSGESLEQSCVTVMLPTVSMAMLPVYGNGVCRPFGSVSGTSNAFEGKQPPVSHFQCFFR